MIEPQEPLSVSNSPLARDQVVRELEENVCRVVRGKREAVRLSLVALLARGHLLIEDVPGVGKTTLASALARSLGLSFQRVQFTADLMPADIIGVSVFDQKDSQFRFVPGPLFAHVVLADEINRATPKTQSALLEAMGEGTVTVDRQRYRLPDPFWVVATQNPLEYRGTFPLPESQLDRFLMSIQLGYPDREAERGLVLGGGADESLRQLRPVCDTSTLLTLQEQVQRIHVEQKIGDYVISIAEATRRGGPFVLGASTRGAQGVVRAAQALAVIEGREFVVPDDIKRVVAPVLAHRVLLRGSHDPNEAARQINKLVGGLPVPA